MKIPLLPLCICQRHLNIFKCGLHTQQLSSCLDDYLLFQQQRWIRQIKLVCIGIQCFSYGFIALIVVLIYQIMLLPLEMIGSF